MNKVLVVAKEINEIILSGELINLLDEKQRDWFLQNCEELNSKIEGSSKSSKFSSP